MKILTWGSGYHWNDINLRWGNPSYILEPGDPGYIPPPDSAPLSTPKPKKRTMPKSDYLSTSDDAFSAQLKTFKLNIPSYSALLGVSAAQVTNQAADSDYFAYVLACQQTMQNGAQQWTKWKTLVSGGGSAPATGAPVLPTFPTAVAAVPLGVKVRFRALVKQIKANANYNAAIGEALGIEGAEQTMPDLSAIAPVITATISGNHVAIGWGWGGNGNYLDACEIQVDRSDTHGFVLLTYDTTPGYTDTMPFPAAPVKWSYRAIYRVGDTQVGVWSNVVSVTVGG